MRLVTGGSRWLATCLAAAAATLGSIVPTAANAATDGAIQGAAVGDGRVHRPDDREVRRGRPGDVPGSVRERWHCAP